MCKGCKRFYNEIIDWNGWDDTQKKAVYQRLESLMADAMADKLQINQPDLLEAALQIHGIHYRHFTSPCWWLFLLWIKKPEALDNWKNVGVTIAKPYQSLPPTALLNQIDDTVNIASQILFDKR